MAERFQKYRRRPLRLPDVPSVDFVSAGRAQQQAAGSIAQSLDKIADFVFEAEKKEAIEYGVENAPTEEQIKRARETGEALNIPKGDFAKAAATTVVRSRMEMSVLREVNKLDADPETLDMSFAEYAGKLNSIINGYGSVLDDNIDKAVGASFRADMTKTYNQHLVSWGKEKIKQQKETNRAGDFAAAQSIISSLDKIIYGGSVQSQADGTITSSIDVANDQIEKIRALPHLTATESNALVQQAEKAKLDLITQRVGEWVLESPETNVSELLTGKVQDPNVALLLNELDPVQRRAVVIGAADQIAQEETINKGISDALARKLKERTDKISDLALDAYLTGDRVEQEKQMAALKAIDLGEYNKLSETFMNEGGKDHNEVVESLSIAAANGTITMENVLANRGNLSLNTFKDFVGKVKTRRNEDHNIALDMARATLGISKNSLMVDNEKAARLSKAENALNLAARKDPSIDRVAWMQTYIDSEMNAEIEAEKKAARVQIEAAKKLAKIEPGEDTDDEFIQYVDGRRGNAQYYKLQMRRLQLLGLVKD